MKSFKLFSAILLFNLVGNHSHASIRIDIPDRTPEDVVKQAHQLATTVDFSNVTGCLYEGERIIGTGIAIDRYTVLTAAHVLANRTNFIFNLNTNGWLQEEDGQPSGHWITAPPIVHPGFRNADNDSLYLSSVNNQLFLNETPFDEVARKNFQELNEFCASHGKIGIGVDLAILKLNKPLSSKLKFPKIHNVPVIEEEQYGVSLGYGVMRYNHQDKPPTMVTNDENQGYRRHLISTKVRSGLDSGRTCVLYGSYRGLCVNGVHSFITNNDMRKTEGLHLEGDSGGPLLFQVGKTYELAGIISTRMCLNPQPVTDARKRLVFGNQTQQIFPEYIHLAHYLPWINENMGPLKK